MDKLTEKYLQATLWTQGDEESLLLEMQVWRQFAKISCWFNLYFDIYNLMFFFIPLSLYTYVKNVSKVKLISFNNPIYIGDKDSIRTDSPVGH